MHTNEQAMGKGVGCDVCGAEVGTNERLLRHVEREHAYQCPVRNSYTDYVVINICSAVELLIFQLTLNKLFTKQ